MGHTTMKQQAALEYLTMYGLAIIIIAAVLVALFLLGVFNPQQFVSQQCAMAGGFQCLSYSMAANGMLTLVISQSTISPIEVNGVGCYVNSGSMNIEAPNNPPNNEIYMQIGSNATFYAQCYNSANVPFTGSIGDIYTGSIAVSYINSVKGYHEIATGALAIKISH